jgi:hypothetical protein
MQQSIAATQHSQAQSAFAHFKTVRIASYFVLNLGEAIEGPGRPRFTETFWCEPRGKLGAGT